MTLEPLLNALLPVQIHAATVIPAFFIGTWQLFISRKGSPLHRVAGYTYLILMTMTAISTLWIHEVNPAGPFGLSFIHLFVPLTLFGVTGALRGVWTGNIRVHRSSMISMYIGALLIAGGLAFMPGRIMHTVVFGS